MCDMFDLETFLPYQLSILSQSISGLIAREYESKFALTMNQWRCLVIIYAHEPVTAKDISNFTLLDKMTISRAVKVLQKRRLVNVSTSGHDARSRMLSISKIGKEVYDQVIPFAQDYESRLLASLTNEQQLALQAIIKTLMRQSEELS